MDEPDEDLKAPVDGDASPPDFDALTPIDDLVRGGRTRDDFFDAVLALASPATVEEVAERADHGRDAAREYLEWFDRLGIVTRITDSPATYERNDAYLAWRRVQQLREHYTTDELVALLDSAAEREQRYSERFGVDEPDAVSITAAATDADRSVESVWEAVSAWQTARRQIDLLEQALATDADDSPSRTSTV